MHYIGGLRPPNYDDISRLLGAKLGAGRQTARRLCSVVSLVRLVFLAFCLRFTSCFVTAYCLMLLSVFLVSVFHALSKISAVERDVRCEGDLIDTIASETRGDHTCNEDTVVHNRIPHWTDCRMTEELVQETTSLQGTARPNQGRLVSPPPCISRSRQKWVHQAR